MPPKRGKLTKLMLLAILALCVHAEPMFDEKQMGRVAMIMSDHTPHTPPHDFFDTETITPEHNKRNHSIIDDKNHTEAKADAKNHNGKKPTSSAWSVAGIW